ncbi:MAG: hypothetical protein LAO77_03545 [Acidobacteriia bacterium]|nr:hypothetical protein [Terriglobia bacterium]
MTRSNLAAGALFLLVAAAVFPQAARAAQVNVTGEWALEVTTPNGHVEYTLYLNQEGPRVTGHLTSEYGETPVKVTLNGDAITLAWSQAEGGKTIDISLAGTVKGDSMTGTAKLGTVGQGPFQADRTSSY